MKEPDLYDSIEFGYLYKETEFVYKLTALGSRLYGVQANLVSGSLLNSKIPRIVNMPDKSLVDTCCKIQTGRFQPDSAETKPMDKCTHSNWKEIKVR